MSDDIKLPVDTSRWRACSARFEEQLEALRRVIEGFSIGDIPSEDRAQAMSQLDRLRETIDHGFRIRKEEARMALIRATVMTVEESEVEG